VEAVSEQIADLDPRWEWIDVREFSDPGPKWLRGPCRHTEVIPVESTEGAVVARLCTTCDTQLPE
jgi:hypothetical protein